MPPPALSIPSAAERWDIFCAVIDNHGDIGVSWRLARQLAAEHGSAVRLWVDDLAAFAPLCPSLDQKLAHQRIAGVDIRHWRRDFVVAEAPGDVVVEAFGCALPEDFVAAMAHRQTAPCWINLEYLSAESWTIGCHGLASPQPRRSLKKYFFFPGFDAASGGLLRERELIAQRDAFVADAAARAAFWRDFGLLPPAADALCVSLFAYENPAIDDLLALWAVGDTSVCCCVPVSRALARVEEFCGRSLAAGDVIRRGALELRVLPFVEQSRYDRLLWACDLNIVRGEDSFVRAQWAAKPLVWHIYPQAENAHLLKLDAFLDLYLAVLSPAAAGSVRDFGHAWNRGSVDAACWNTYSAALPELRRHAQDWSTRLADQQDMLSRLVHFCRSRV